MFALDLQSEPQLVTYDTEKVARDGFEAFAKLAWHEVEPHDLVWSWHMSEICKHLEAISRGECRNLIINVPPGMSKSTLVSVLWPAWDWLINPKRRYMFGTFDGQLALRDALRTRKLVNSEWFQNRWGDIVQIDESADVQTNQSVYSTTQGGRRLSTTVRGRATGWHADIQVVDDPNKPEELQHGPEAANSALDRVWTWYNTTMASRRTGRQFARVIIMQRLHENDLVGRILEHDKKNHAWTHLMLPMVFEPERKSITRWGGDHRTRAGELLVPERYDEAAVADTRAANGSIVFATQYQQRPAPESGSLFKREWFSERWDVLPADLQYAISIDATFKDSAGADFVSMQVWGSVRSKFYLVDRIHDRLGLPETVRCLRHLCNKYPRARLKLIEDKANGPAIEQTLRHEMPGIVMVTPEGGKIARANAMAPIAEARNIVFPSDTQRPWIGEMVEEVVSFPNARHDDDVDAMTQYINYVTVKNVGRYVQAMHNIKGM